jgi:hypothetical protein
MLASMEVLSEHHNDRFALTALGAALRSDVANSVRDRAIYYGAQRCGVYGAISYIASRQESPHVSTYMRLGAMTCRSYALLSTSVGTTVAPSRPS